MAKFCSRKFTIKLTISTKTDQQYYWPRWFEATMIWVEPLMH